MRADDKVGLCAFFKALPGLDFSDSRADSTPTHFRLTQIVCLPSEAWRFLLGERPCRTRLNQPIVPSVAVMKEAAKASYRSNRRIEKTLSANQIFR
jgi:hypothetical protein